MRRTQPLIVGGGPAGSAAAITLARGGARAHLIERSAGVHTTVCGAFMGWDAIARAEALGLDLPALGAQPIERVRVITGERVLERALPYRAVGLSRRALDQALLERAAALGACVERGVAARRIDDEGVHLSDGRILPRDALFLATGKHNLRGAPPRGGKAGAIGLRLGLGAQSDLAGWIELHLFASGYAGLLVQENGEANLCLSVQPERLAAAGGTPAGLMAALAAEAPRLAERWAGTAGDWSAVAAVPYGWRAQTTSPGCFRIGDQAAVIASLVGDGIAIALASGAGAAEAWLKGTSAPAFQHHFARRAARPIRVAELLRHGAERPALAGALAGLLATVPGGVALAARLTRIGH